MTKAEIDREIKRECRRIDNLKKKIEELKYDIKATKDSIKFWKEQKSKIQANKA